MILSETAFQALLKRWMLFALAPNCCSWNEVAEWYPPPLPSLVREAVTCCVGDRQFLSVAKPVEEEFDFLWLTSVCKPVSCAKEEVELIVKWFQSRQSISNKLSRSLKAEVFNLDHFNDPSYCNRGSSDCSKLWHRDPAEWQWPEVESSLNGFAAEESTCTTTSWDLQRWLLSQPSLSLCGRTREPFLCCRSWSTSNVWQLIHWFAAHAVAAHSRSWGVGLCAGTWSHSEERKTTSSSMMSRCSSVLAISCCAKEVSQHGTTWCCSWETKKKKGRRTMWMSL